MTANSLQLWFECDTDGAGELFAQVQSEGFSGHSSAYFGQKQIVEFAQRLANTFPLSADEPLKLEGGFWSKRGAPILQLHVHFGICFCPIGHLGLIGCHVSLATPIYSESRIEEQSQVAVELHTHYELLRSFARSLEMLANGAIAEAVLHAEK